MGSQPIRIQLWKILWENIAGNSCGKYLQENLAGNSCGKFLCEILAENLAGKSCMKFLQENLAGNSCGKILWENLVGNAVGNLVENLAEKVLMACNGSKNGKKTTKIGNFWHLWEIFKPITTTKTLLNYFCLVEEVLSFNLVGHMWKSVNNWLQKCIFYGKSCGKFSKYASHLQEMLWEMLLENIHSWSQFLTEFHIWPTKLKLRNSSTRWK